MDVRKSDDPAAWHSFLFRLVRRLSIGTNDSALRYRSPFGVTLK